MKWVDFLRGTAHLSVRGAYPQTFLNRLAAQRIDFWDVARLDDMTLEVTVYRAMLPRCVPLAERAMCELTVLNLHGFRSVFYGLRHRPVLLIGLTIAVMAAMLSQRFIWSLQVEGNVYVRPEVILRALEELDVRVGTPCSQIQPQELENRMLELVPELSWLTVNANSALATVEVRERIPVPELVPTRQPTNVVASRTGIIEEMEVYGGQAVVEKGQVVTEGQLLVSGVGTAWRATVLHHAMAEIYARTWHGTEILSLPTALQKTAQGETTLGLRLIIGKHAIKIFGNSGILRPECDKIIVSNQLTLPGGIALPVTLEWIHQTQNDLTTVERDADAARERILHAYVRSVQAGLVAGSVLRSEAVLTQDGAVWRVRTGCECREQIGVLAPILTETKDDEFG